MYLATADSKAVQEGNSQVFMTLLIEIPFYFRSRNDRSHWTFSLTSLALILPYFECIDFLHIVHAWWDMESVLGFIICPKEVERRPKSTRNVLSNGSC